MIPVRSVFSCNLEQELWNIRAAIDRCPLVSIDTEFPGTIYKQDRRPDPHDSITNYQFMKANVDELKIIQLGLTLSDAQGNRRCVWEFNFQDFDIDSDLHDKDSIELLKKQGIDFLKNRESGIDSREFAAKIWISNLLSNHSLSWITFHGAYDFGFLMKIVTQKKLPFNLPDFKYQLLRCFGSRIIDLKHTVHGGLERVAENLTVGRVAGMSHQAGSDSLLTLDCFIVLRKRGCFVKSEDSGLMQAPFGLYGLVSEPCWTPLGRCSPPLRGLYGNIGIVSRPRWVPLGGCSAPLAAVPWRPNPFIAIRPFNLV
ncbi:Ribonuclease CAF1 [Corchorus olitorius]|uniref:poly(A)-specific ribonuclease n=1 Tax=Corchorus olitorius TaxID=93759 RepID=A0A1R3FU91_9ROSI|nr:Ribonuclease CAF1 [Corchorus olitorius]